jgi:hypothetical protein
VGYATLNGEKGRFRGWPALLTASFLIPTAAFGADSPQLDSITVQARNDREKIQLEVNQFVKSAVVHHSGEPLMRWHTPVCPLVAGLPRDQGPTHVLLTASPNPSLRQSSPSTFRV